MISNRLVILLHTIKNFRGERTINGIIHLLRGKRSIQMIQDGYLFQCLHYFGVFHKRTTTSIMKDIQQLTNDGFIYEWNNYYSLTEKGKHELKVSLQTHGYLNWLDGWKYKDATLPFSYRLLLTVQTISFTTVEQFSFRPIIQDYKTFQWMKKHFPKTVDERKRWAQQMYKELHSILNDVPEQIANIFVAKFSGVKKYGLTNEQISDKFTLDKQNVEMILQATIHYILNVIKANEDDFSLLTLLANDLLNEIHLTHSAEQTYELWKKGFSIDKIAKIRRLKINTIEDHFIEIVITVPNVSIEPFVNQSLQKMIKDVASDIGMTKLRLIKDRLPEEVSYFQIRLVLMSLGGKNEKLTG